ncbi:MAG: flagellin [Myxococcota bacterium]
MLVTAGVQIRLNRALHERRRALRTASQTLGAGLRVKRAADDPAGLAVATNLKVQSRSRQMAIRNVEDARSAADIADGGLDVIAAILTRMRELAVQSASEVLSDRARTYIEDEFDALLDELDATAQGALFNGQGVLSNPGVDVGIVIDSSGSMAGEINRVRLEIEDFQQTFTAARYNVQIGINEFNNTRDSGDNVNRVVALGGGGLVNALNNLSTVGGSTDPWTAITESAGLTNINGDSEPDGFAFREYAVKTLIVISDAGRQANFIPGVTDQDIADELAANQIITNVITSGAVTGTYQSFADETGGRIYDLGNTSGSGIPTALDAIADEIVDALNEADPLSVQADINRGDQIDTGFPIDVTLNGLDMADISVGTVGDARAAIDRIDGSIDVVGAARSQVGAIQRRLDHTLSRHYTTLEAETAAASRIEDADMAKVANAMASAQIRMQAAVAANVAAKDLDRQQLDRLLSDR